MHPIIQSWAKGTLAEDHPELSSEQRRAVGLIASGHATEDQLEAAGEEFVRTIKSSSGFVQSRDALCGPAEEKVHDPDSPTIPWVISDESPDRMGDIIRQKGWDTRNFKRNPVILFGHNSSAEPIGRGSGLRKGEVKRGSKTFPATLMDVTFAVDESDDAAQKFRLARGGFLKAGSVGFIPTKTTHVSDDEERSKLGLGRFGVVFEKQELLEFSIVSIPANPNALQEGIKNGTLTDDDAEYLAAIGDPTEKEWEKRLRKRNRSFIDMGANSTGDLARAVEELCRQLSEKGAATTDNSAGVVSTTTKGTSTDNAWTWIEPTYKGPSPEDITKNTEAMQELAESNKMLARSVAELCRQLAARTGADGELDDGQDDATDLQSLTESLRRFRRDNIQPLTDQ